MFVRLISSLEYIIHLPSLEGPPSELHNGKLESDDDMMKITDDFEDDANDTLDRTIVVMVRRFAGEQG